VVERGIVRIDSTRGWGEDEADLGILTERVTDGPVKKSLLVKKVKSDRGRPLGKSSDARGWTQDVK